MYDTPYDLLLMENNVLVKNILNEIIKYKGLIVGEYSDIYYILNQINVIDEYKNLLTFIKNRISQVLNHIYLNDIKIDGNYLKNLLESYIRRFRIYSC